MLPLNTHARIRGIPRRDVLKVITVDEFVSSSYEPEQCALWVAKDDPAHVTAIRDVKWGAVFPAAGSNANAAADGATIEDMPSDDVVKPGDVILLNPARETIYVLYRRGARSNSLLVTERCNSFCVMCSQPPVEREDDGRLEQLRSAIELIDRDEAQLGITGGEPTLLGEGLFSLLRSCGHHLPNTHLHVLTNGRLFSDEALAQAASSASKKVTWGIPLYSDAPEIHDFVVQRRGAFAETMGGLLNLGRYGQSIELRIVIQRAVVPRLLQLAHFIARNLTFVDHVAWMGLEPMGFARGNWKAIWIEPDEYVAPLADAIYALSSQGMTTSIYNVPLCVLPSSLWPYARQSISDWKNEYRTECEGCAVRSECCGFFSSVRQQHLPRGIKPIASSAWTRHGEEHA